MLTSLQVRNFALIDHLELQFGAGLNILTGETGAGKSIVIDALGLAIGERASIEMVRAGTDRFTVEAVFSLCDAPPSTHQKIADEDLENDDEPTTLVMARELSKTGKSQSRVNGRLVSTSTLRAIGQYLVDVHGQHDHQSLLSPDTHIDLLDNWMGEEALSVRRSVAVIFAELTQLRRELATIQQQERERIRSLDLYKFQRNEIEEASLTENEFDELNAERSRLTNLEKLQTIADESYHSLNRGAVDALRTSLGSLQKAAMLDPNVQLAIDQLAESSAYLEEAIVRLRRYRESLEPEPGRLEKINERLDLIHSLQRKYGDTIPEIIAFAGDIKQKIYSLEDTEAMESELTRRIGSLEANIIKLSGKLSDYRKSGGVKFSKLIVAELSDLAMSQTTFGVSVEPAPVISSTGADKVEFLISTNTGEPLRPLAKIASGGETSRLMLAIKSILARSSFVPTVIFDEIDIGIGGRTGRIIADKLAAMSSFAQVLCITHLPQIASRPAFAHFSIEKRTAAGRTTVSVVQLGPNERELEIARMLGGEQSQTVLQHAREMLSLI